MLNNILSKPLRGCKPKKELEQLLELGAIPSFRFYFMLGLAAAIATLGLIADSTATVIGAMIIAPMMNPILSLSYGLLEFKPKLLRKAIVTSLTGILWSIFVSWFIVQSLGIKIAGSEMLARTNPNLLDLGVAIASGTAGAFAMTRRAVSNADVLPGVAIAVALVPPLCVVGTGLALGPELIIDPTVNTDYRIINDLLNVGEGAFLLFLTNFIAVVFSGGLVFLLQGYGRFKTALIGLFLSLVVLTLIALPLKFSFDDFRIRSIILRQVGELGQENPHWSKARLLEIRLNLDVEPPIVEFDVLAPPGVITATDVKVIENALSELRGKPVDFDVNLIEFNRLKKVD
ncbi:MAG: DUF389 domain-containing protein [Xenococcaceae cyanobacterium MO_234.B1]|nr:DUF389 domain-containing protein [Xenococcaceae cyanobacterium MO_234.B1]